MERTPVNKGIRTALQAALGALVGLVAVVWAVPGVPEAVVDYVTSPEVLYLVTAIGVPSGVIAFVQNKLGK